MAAAGKEQQAEKEVAARVGPWFTLYADGSVLRKSPLPHRASDGRTSKDVSINKERGQWARIFLPSAAAASGGDQLPVVLYFHGGAMLWGGPEWDYCHSFCEAMAARSGAVWVSASYRLAPENRLPTPIDDGAAALGWLVRSVQEEEEPWLGRADVSRLFLAGESAGGVIAHHVVAAGSTDIPVRGVILIHPGFFNYRKRSQEEVECYQDDFMSWDMADASVPLLLPPGRPLSDASPVLNPIPAIASSSGFRFPPRTLVALAERDALHFLGLHYVQALRDAGHHVEHIVSPGVGHVFFIYLPDSEQALTLMDTIANFITRGENA
jgi:acetyl esterase/lipase